MTIAPADSPFSERIVVRFGATLLANILRIGLSFVSGIIVARGLGASGYGDLNFLLGSFVAISQLVEAGTSSAFYTFISQQRRGRTFFALYFGWIGIQFVGTLLVIGALLPKSLIERIWLGHQRTAVLLAFLASFLITQVWALISQLGEATRKTLVIQAGAVTQAAIHLTLIALALYMGWLSVRNVLLLLVCEYVLLVVVLGPRLLRENRAEVAERARVVLKEFGGFCKPLLLYGWLAFLYTFADRWLLQRFGGSAQQGFFAVGQQFANISLLATMSILKVFWKEIAEARDRQNHERVKQLYTAVSRSLYFAAAWMSCLLIPFSREVLSWTLGPRYEGAWLCLALMFLYPIHQTLSQIQQTVFVASGHAGAYAKIGLPLMALSIPCTYFVLAPLSAGVPGLGMGSVGLALKMVVLQIVGVTLQSYVIARTNGWSRDYGYQALVIALLLGLSWVTKIAVGELFIRISGQRHPIGVIVVTALVYVVFSAAIVYRSPGLAGLSREQTGRLVAAVAQRLRLWAAVEYRI